MPRITNKKRLECGGHDEMDDNQSNQSSKPNYHKVGTRARTQYIQVQDSGYYSEELYDSDPT